MNSHPGIALITGASSGIGAAFARRLARDGYDLILHGRREALLNQWRDEFAAAYGTTSRVVLAELSDPAGVRMLEEIIAATPSLSMLVNNAGFSTPHYFEQEGRDGQQRLVEVHVVAPLRLMHAAIPVMRARGGGSIINVSSVAGFMVGPASATYCATKACLTNFTETLHIELKGSGIRVQALCPGFTVTDFHRRMGYDTTAEFFKNFMSAEEVVSTSLRDLEKGKVVSIPGMKYKLAALLSRYLPRRLMYVGASSVRRRQHAEGGLPVKREGDA
jgi:short-subunit dehydrogenase